MTTYKTRQEVLRAASDWMDVCEAAGVEARCRVTHTYDYDPISRREVHRIADCNFALEPSAYEFPIGLIDGKEVWEGDTVYDAYYKPHKADSTLTFGSLSFWSLTPPKPKTYAVELSEEDVRDILDFDALSIDSVGRILRNLRKALEQPK